MIKIGDMIMIKNQKDQLITRKILKLYFILDLMQKIFKKKKKNYYNMKIKMFLKNILIKDNKKIKLKNMKKKYQKKKKNQKKKIMKKKIKNKNKKKKNNYNYQ